MVKRRDGGGGTMTAPQVVGVILKKKPGHQQPQHRPHQHHLPHQNQLHQHQQLQQKQVSCGAIPPLDPHDNKIRGELFVEELSERRFVSIRMGWLWVEGTPMKLALRALNLRQAEPSICQPHRLALGFALSNSHADPLATFWADTEPEWWSWVRAIAAEIVRQTPFRSQRCLNFLGILTRCPRGPVPLPDSPTELQRRRCRSELRCWPLAPAASPAPHQLAPAGGRGPEHDACRRRARSELRGWSSSNSSDDDHHHPLHHHHQQQLRLVLQAAAAAAQRPWGCSESSEGSDDSLPWAGPATSGHDAVDGPLVPLVPLEPLEQQPTTREQRMQRYKEARRRELEARRQKVLEEDARRRRASKAPQPPPPAPPAPPVEENNNDRGSGKASNNNKINSSSSSSTDNNIADKEKKKNEVRGPAKPRMRPRPSEVRFDESTVHRQLDDRRNNNNNNNNIISSSSNNNNNNKGNANKAEAGERRSRARERRCGRVNGGVPGDGEVPPWPEEVSRLLERCQRVDHYVPVRDKLTLFESLSRLGGRLARSTEDLGRSHRLLQPSPARPKQRASSLHDLSRGRQPLPVREMCRLFESPRPPAASHCLSVWRQPVPGRLALSSSSAAPHQLAVRQ